MLKSFVVALSTYSKIPMPRIEWDEKSMKYSLCCFPFVGVLIGLLMLGCYRLCEWMEIDALLRGVIFTSLPILLTGGIHMDGFMDTVDAKSSYRSKEERLEILKDPHAGSFAIVYCCLYLIASVVFFSVLQGTQLVFVAMGYVYSRVLSGLSVVTFKKAKNQGMLWDTAKNSAKIVKWIMGIEYVLCFAFIMTVAFLLKNITADVIQVWYGVSVILAGLIAFVYYRYTAGKWFGGITGDLAGYFLQLCELSILVAVAIVG